MARYILRDLINKLSLRQVGLLCNQSEEYKCYSDTGSEKSQLDKRIGWILVK